MRVKTYNIIMQNKQVTAQNLHEYARPNDPALLVLAKNSKIFPNEIAEKSIKQTSNHTDKLKIIGG